MEKIFSLLFCRSIIALCLFRVNIWRKMTKHTHTTSRTAANQLNCFDLAEYMYILLNSMPWHQRYNKSCDAFECEIDGTNCLIIAIYTSTYVDTLSLPLTISLSLSLSVQSKYRHRKLIKTYGNPLEMRLHPRMMKGILGCANDSWHICSKDSLMILTKLIDVDLLHCSSFRHQH